MASQVAGLPESLQLKILSLVAGSAGAAPAASASTAVRPAATPSKESKDNAWAIGLASRLIAHGYSWQDEMAPIDSVARPLLQAVHALPEPTLAPAKMGSSVLKWHDPSARGDSICWVPLSPAATAPDGSSSPLAPLVASPGWAWLRATLGAVVAALNRDAATKAGGEMLRVPDKVMLARYPAGARYVKQRILNLRHGRAAMGGVSGAKAVS